MPIALEIPLPDPLPVVHPLLVHPAPAPARQGPPRARPVQVLALAGPLGAGAVLEARVPRGEIAGPVLGGGGEVRGPDQVGAVDGGAFVCGGAGWGGRGVSWVGGCEGRWSGGYLGCGF